MLAWVDRVIAATGRNVLQVNDLNPASLGIKLQHETPVLQRGDAAMTVASRLSLGGDSRCVGEICDQGECVVDSAGE